jgi:hypothetical protein
MGSRWKADESSVVDVASGGKHLGVQSIVEALDRRKTLLSNPDPFGNKLGRGFFDGGDGTGESLLVAVALGGGGTTLATRTPE